MAEPIHDFAALALHQQAALEQQRLREPGGEQTGFQPVARLRGVAEPQLLDASAA